MSDIIEFLKESNAIEGIYDDASYLQSLKAWDYLLSLKKLVIESVLKTHSIIMLNQPHRIGERGHFRRIVAYPSGGGSLPPGLVYEEMRSWCAFINEPEICIDPKPWKYLHIMYEKVHPFVDGNGRTGRMFMNWQRLQAGLPILVIKESEKEEYFEWFE